MISYLKGKIILKKEKFIILDVNGVGYKVFISKKTFLELPEEEIRIYTSLVVKENALDLYGFLGGEEMEFFQILERISGVGPKAALEISSLGKLENLKEQIENGDTQIFEDIPGIGKKKAQKIVLELSGKLRESLKEKKGEESNEVYQTLKGLGFSKKEIEEALTKIPLDVISSEDKIKKILKILGKKT